MKSDCGYDRLALLDLVEGSLPREAEAEARRHVSRCSACRLQLRKLEESAAALPDPATLRPAPEIRSRVLQAARAPSPVRVRSGIAARFGRQRRQWLAVGGILAGLGAAVLAGVVFSPENGLLVAGNRVPVFQAIDVSSGAERSLADFQGEVVLLNIWATWCAPCEAEMPSMERLHRALGPDGLRVVAVSVDQESTHKVKRWADARGLTFTILHDRSGRIEQLYQTTGVPESFVIDRRGRLLKREIGPREWDGASHTALFRRLLADGG